MPGHFGGVGYQPEQGAHVDHDYNFIFAKPLYVWSIRNLYGDGYLESWDSTGRRDDYISARNKPLGTGPLSGGSATFTTSALTGGTDQIKASYGGDSNFGSSKVEASGASGQPGAYHDDA